MNKNKFTITKSFNSDELIDIDDYISQLHIIITEYNDIFINGYIERVKHHINLLECFKKCIIDYDLLILQNSKFNFLDYDIINGLTGEIIYFGGY